MQMHPEMAKPCPEADSTHAESVYPTGSSASVEQMRLFIEYCPAAIAMFDQDMRYLLVSRQWQEYYGLGDREVIGRSHYDLFPEADHWRAIHQRCLMGAVERCDGESFRRPDGSVDWLRWEMRPWYDSAGNIGGLMMFTELITERRSAELSLQRINEELEDRMEARTAELQQTVERSQTEIVERNTIQRQQGEAEEERKRTLQELRESQQRLELLVQQTPIAIVEWNKNFEITQWNPAAERIFGYCKQEVLGRHADFLIPEDTRAQVHQIVDTLHHQHAGIVNINRNLTKDGRTIICEWHNTPLVNSDGEIIGTAGLALDITERKQAEAALFESEARHRALLEAIPDMLFRYDRNGVYLDFFPSIDWDPAVPVEFFLGKSVEEVLPANVAQQILSAIGTALDTGNLQLIEYQLELNGEPHDYEARIVTSGENEVITIVRDITEQKANERDRKAAEEALRLEKEFTHVVIENVSNGVVACDAQGTLKLFNRVAREWHGCDLRVVSPEKWTDLYSLYEADGITPLATEKAPLLRAFQGESVREVGMSILAKGQPPRYILASGDPLFDAEGHKIGAVVILQDITERKRTEAQLKQQAADLEEALQELQQAQAQIVQSEKMSSLGQLVAGVAHEINNPVSFIFGNLAHANKYTQDLLRLLELYKEYHPNPHPAIQAEAEEIDLDFLIEDLPKLLNSMKVGADRIQKIVASLRTFSRMDEAEMKEVNIHDGIDSTLMILQSRIKAHDERPAIEIIKDYGDLPPVECYAGQLNQVFMNILSNAIDALEENFLSGKKRTALNEGVSTPNAQLLTLNSPPTITIRTQYLDNDCVKISIADNGPGIPKEMRQRLFDPFFTTKPVGKGTGMGLSISYQIVAEKHRGSLYCLSEPGKGAEFVIQIPLRQKGGAV